MSVLNLGVLNTRSSVVGANYFSTSSNVLPSKPISVDVDPDDGSDRTPLFSWLSSIDLESDNLTYEIAMFDSSGLQLGSAMVSGIDLPESALSVMRSPDAECRRKIL